MAKGACSCHLTYISAGSVTALVAPQLEMSSKKKEQENMPRASLSLGIGTERDEFVKANVTI